MGEQLNQLQAFWSQCMAKITATDFLRDLTLNFGLGLAFEGVGWLLEDAEEGAPALCELCFAAGTPVQTDHGAVPIESIKVGDKVWARNAGTGKNEMQPVTAIAPQHRDQLVEIRIPGETTPLRTTPVHPFRARRNASDSSHWIKAGDLVAGEQLETEDGHWVAVQSVTPIKGLATVYNFTVANDHDYFVGETGFLVHNAMPCGCKFPDNPGDMNDILGFEGTDVPDLPTTPGRNKTIWNLAQGVQLRYEAHPYFPPGLDPGEYIPHWQLKYPGAPKPNPRWFPGDNIPGCK